MNTRLSRLTLAAHIMKALACAQAAGRPLALQGLVKELGVLRREVEDSLQRLQVEGLVDVARMRPTVHGFALGASLVNRRLAPLRPPNVGRLIAA